MEEKHLAGKHDQDAHASGQRQKQLSEKFQRIGGRLGLASGLLTGATASKDMQPAVHANAGGELGMRLGGRLAARKIADYLRKNPKATRAQKVKAMLSIALGGTIGGAVAGVGAGYTLGKFSPKPKVTGAALNSAYGYVGGRETGHKLGTGIGKVWDSAEDAVDKLTGRRKKAQAVLKHLAGQHDQQKHAGDLASLRLRLYQPGDVVDVNRLPADIREAIRREGNSWNQGIGKKYTPNAVIAIKADSPHHTKEWLGQHAIVIAYTPKNDQSYYKIVGITGQVRGKVKTIRPRRDIISEKSKEMESRLRQFEQLDRLESERIEEVVLLQDELITLREKLRLKPAIDLLEESLPNGAQVKDVTIYPIVDAPSGENGGRFTNYLRVNAVSSVGKENFVYRLDDKYATPRNRLTVTSLALESDKPINIAAYEQTVFANLIDTAIADGREVLVKARQAPMGFWAKRQFEWIPPKAGQERLERLKVFVQATEEKLAKALGEDKVRIPEHDLIDNASGSDPEPLDVSTMFNTYKDLIGFIYSKGSDEFLLRKGSR